MAASCMKHEKPRIRMIVIHDWDGYSAFATVGKHFIVAMGNSFDDFLDKLLAAVNFSFEDEGISYGLEEISLVSSQAEGVQLTDAYRDTTYVEG
jgi:hypothetical protein